VRSNLDSFAKNNWRTFKEWSIWIHLNSEINSIIQIRQQSMFCSLVEMRNTKG